MLNNFAFTGPARRSLVVAVAFLVFAGCGRSEELAPLKIKLPAPTFIGTPSDSPASPNVEKPRASRARP